MSQDGHASTTGWDVETAIFASEMIRKLGLLFSIWYASTISVTS